MEKEVIEMMAIGMLKKLIQSNERQEINYEDSEVEITGEYTDGEYYDTNEINLTVKFKER